MSSILILHSNPQQFFATAQTYTSINLTQNHVDLSILTPEKGSIGIDSIRQLKSFLKNSPLQSNQKIVLIPKADQLTLPAQNALLKTLEEPPSYAQIILGSLNTQQLLPTIISRCQVILAQLPSPAIKPKENGSLYFENYLQALEYAKKNSSSKQSALTAIKKILHRLRSKLHQIPLSNQLTHIMSIALTTHYRISHNANPQLSLEHLCFQLVKKPQKNWKNHK